MLRFIVKRILTMLLTLFVIMTLTFFIMHAIPGGPYSAGKRLPEEIQAALDEKYKLNDPLYVQFFDYMNGVLHFDLGPSFKYEGMSVNDLIAQGFPTSATLGLLSMLFTLALSIPLGVLAALKRGKWQDTSRRSASRFPPLWWRRCWNTSSPSRRGCSRSTAWPTGRATSCR